MRSDGNATVCRFDVDFGHLTVFTQSSDGLHCLVERIQFDVEVEDGGIDTGVRSGSRPAEVVDDARFRFAFLEHYAQWVRIEVAERNLLEWTFTASEV